MNFEYCYFKGRNPLNQKQKEGERGQGYGEALRDGHSGVASETSGHGNNMLIDGTDNEVENPVGATGGAKNILVDGTNNKVKNSVGATGDANNILIDGENNEFENSVEATISKDSDGAKNTLVIGKNNKVKNSVGATSSKNSGGANNMLVDKKNIEVENSVEATVSKDSDRSNNMQVNGSNINIQNSGGGFSSNNPDSAKNVVIEGNNINVKDCGSGSGSNNSSGEKSLVIKGNNINFKNYGSGSGSNNSSRENSLLIKENNINFKDYGSGSGSNNSSEANNLLFKSLDVNLGGAVISKKSGGNLRPVIIPQEMVGNFRKKAESNADDQLETSAILLGKKSKNEFTITHLLFLPQSENQNSCVTDIQDKLLAKQNELGLIALGWISTHSPMDSIGFHKCFGNQQLGKEAIAIVVPRDGGIGIYQLTTLKFIADSRTSGMHLKNERKLLDKNPPHVKFDSLKMEFMDFK